MTEPHSPHVAIQALSITQRIELAQALLDSVHGELGDTPPSPEVCAELDRRIASLQAGAPLIQWEEVRREFLSPT